jgi:hypothetical protein
MNKKRVLLAAAAVCAIAILCAFVFLRPRNGVVMLINDAKESVIHATVEINGSKFDFDDIPPDGTRRMEYRSKPGNHYTVAVQFRYDRKLEPVTGYFTDLSKESHQMVVKRDEVVMESGE